MRMLSADQKSAGRFIRQAGSLEARLPVTVHGRRYDDEVVVLDGIHFVNCIFSECELRYAGGNLAFLDCEFAGCCWRLAGPAKRTAELIESLRVRSRVSEPN